MSLLRIHNAIIPTKNIEREKDNIYIINYIKYKRRRHYGCEVLYIYNFLQFFLCRVIRFFQRNRKFALTTELKAMNKLGIFLAYL